MGGIFGALSTLATIGDPDLFWHLAQGRQTVTDGLARVDTFSWSVNGLPVLTDQWLGQQARQIALRDAVSRLAAYGRRADGTLPDRLRALASHIYAGPTGNP